MTAMRQAIAFDIRIYSMGRGFRPVEGGSAIWRKNSAALSYIDEVHAVGRYGHAEAGVQSGTA